MNFKVFFLFSAQKKVIVWLSEYWHYQVTAAQPRMVWTVIETRRSLTRQHATSSRAAEWFLHRGKVVDIFIYFYYSECHKSLNKQTKPLNCWLCLFQTKVEIWSSHWARSPGEAVNQTCKQCVTMFISCFLWLAFSLKILINSQRQPLQLQLLLLITPYSERCL